MKKILFVCTGNTCRSPMAEGLMKSISKDKYEISSAGIHAFDGEPASTNAIEAIRDYGISIENHRAKVLAKEMVESAEIILCMTLGHKQRVVEKYHDAEDKIFTLLEYAKMDGDIVDPFGMSLEMYKSCAKDIYLALEKVWQRISNT